MCKKRNAPSQFHCPWGNNTGRDHETQGLNPSFLPRLLTQIPGGEGRCGRAAGRRRPAAEDGAVGLVVDQAGHEGALLVLHEPGGVAACRAQAGVVLVVVVVAGGVTAGGPLVSAKRAGLQSF